MVLINTFTYLFSYFDDIRPVIRSYNIL